MMKTRQVDVAVIGSGTAGMTAHKAARLQGKRVLMIESGPYGTTCARVGCMPSKLLIAAAEAAHAVAAAPGFGVHPGSVRIDGKQVMHRVRSERDRFVGFVLDGIDAIADEEKLRGHARFIGPGKLQVGEHSIVEATSIVIASGSTPIVPPEWQAAGERVITSDAVFEWTDLPSSVAVVGSGVIGLELGQALARLGVRVTLFARGNNVAQLTDPLVLQEAGAVLARELDIRFQTSVAHVEKTPDGSAIALTSRDAAGQEKTEQFEYLLAAIGRRPNVDQLGLETAQIALDRHGIPLYDPHTMQCGQSAIFIAGDADNALALLPEAADEGRIAGDNAARFPDVKPSLRRTPLTIAFTEPQIATLGATYRQLCASHAGRFAVGAVSFGNQGRSRVMLQNQGLLRVYAQFGSQRLLGAELIGPRAEHLSHLLAWACQAQLTVPALLDMPFYHPVIEEGVRTALRELALHLAKDPEHAPGCADCSPGV